MKRRCLTLAAILFVTILAIACGEEPAEIASFECTDAIGCVEIAPGEPIKIGVIQDLSGGSALAGSEQTRSIELAVAQRGNQLLGHPVELLTVDEGCTREGGTTAALRIVADRQILAIVGTTCSAAAVAVSEVMSDAGLVMVSATTAPSLTSIGGERGTDWQPGFYRVVWNGFELTQAAAAFAFLDLGVTRAATINDGSTHSRGFAGMFEQAFTEFGGEIVLSGVINKGDTDMDPILAAAVLHEAEFIFLPVRPPESEYIVQQAREKAGMENTKLMAVGSSFLDTFIESVWEDGIGMYFTIPASLEGMGYDELVFAYESSYGQQPRALGFSYAYDAANLIMDTIETVAVQDDGLLHIGRQALRDALNAIVGFEGATGTLSSSEFGDLSRGTFNLVRFDDPAAGLEGLAANVIQTYTSGE